ncbi:MAG: hypothetical protein ABR497_00645 [Kiritimatiellia bacterium]|nr:hypothetical protein [Lentisphaerota bacterium]
MNGDTESVMQSPERVRLLVVAPVNSAMETVRRILFAPFDLSRWLILGFTAWLATMAGDVSWSGINFNFNPGRAMSAADLPARALPWLRENAFLLMAIILPLAVLGLVVSLLVLWVGSRGKFMFLENIVRNRAEVAAPWRRNRGAGNSYFLFSLVFALASLLLLALLLGGLALLALPDWSRDTVGAGTVTALLLGAFTIPLYLLVLACVLALMEDFVVPLMLLRSCRVMAAWRILADLLRQRPGAFALYLLFRTLLQLVLGLLALLLMCATCCLAAVPYVGAVLLLPLHVFMRTYSLHYLEQFGPAYCLMEDAPDDVAAVPAPSEGQDGN